MIKFVLAGIWLCAVTVGAVFFSFQSPAAKAVAEPEPASFGGLDYIKTEIISVPVVRDSAIQGYFLTRLVYTVDPAKLQKLSVPAESLIVDQVYTYLYSNPQIDFSVDDSLDLDAFRAGIRDSVNARVEDKLVHEVLIEQVDFLSKAEIRDNSLRRRAEAPAVPAKATPAAGH